MKKFCSHCGTELDSAKNFCPNCGKPIYANYNFQNNVDKNANIGFILGLISIVAWIIPLFGFPITICASIFSAKGLNSNEGRTKAIIGLVLSIVFLCLTLFNSILGAIIGAGY